MRVPALRERQEDELEILFPAFVGATGHAGDCAGRLIRHDGEKLRDLRARFIAPQVQERLVFELPAEQRADTRAGQPERMAAAGIEFQDEHVAQGAPDRTRLDLAAFRRATRAPPRLTPAPCRRATRAPPRSPIAEQLAARGLLHTPPSTAASRIAPPRPR